MVQAEPEIVVERGAGPGGAIAAEVFASGHVAQPARRIRVGRVSPGYGGRVVLS